MTEERHEIIDFSPNIPLKVFLHKLSFVAKHWHRSLELLMVVEGIVDISVDDSVYHLGSEDILLINSNSIHELRSESAVLIALQFDMARLKEFDSSLEDAVFDCNSTTCSDATKFQGIRFAIATLLHENSRRSKGAEFKNYSLCYYIISELLNHFQIPTTEPTRKRQKYMARLQRIIKFINAHYMENFTLADLAESEQLSVPYLSNFFYKYMGVKFSQYYTNVKLDHAVAELLNTENSIESVALHNGFTETHTFVRCFKKRYNMLPSVYRRQKKEESFYSSSENLNYLLIEPTNYLHRLSNYLSLPNSESLSPSASGYAEELAVPSVSVLSAGRRLKHTFKKFTSVGRAKELLNADIQNMLRDLQSNVGFEFIKFHGILSDDMMVVSRVNGQLQFHYTLVDTVLDFLLSIGLKPLIQLSFMPRELASDPQKTICYTPFITSPPRDMNEWVELVSDFTQHLLLRYGKKQVCSWLFCVWNEPVTPKSMFGFGDQQMFFQFYARTFRAVKDVCQDLVIGSPSLLYMENLGDETWIRSFLCYCRKNQCMPEFLNFHYYADILPKLSGSNFQLTYVASSSFPKNPDDFALWIRRIRKILTIEGLEDLPLYLTEWNLTLSHRNLINDTCFKSCWVLRNLLQNYDKLDSFGYWSLTDLLEENALPDGLFHGGLGIYTMNGIRKNVFYAFQFANMLGNELLASGEGYFITRSEDKYQIITYNYIHYGDLFASGEMFDVTETTRYTPFDMTRGMHFTVDLKDVENGSYEVREYFVNRVHGSSYDIWLQTGAAPLGAEEPLILRDLSAPGLHREIRLAKDRKLSYSASLEPLEIRIAEIKRIV